MRKNIVALVKIAQSVLSIPHIDKKHKKFVSKTLAAMNPAAKRHAGHEIVVEQAKRLYARRSDNTIEVDDDPIILPAEGGCFVNAWLYVPNASKEER